MSDLRSTAGETAFFEIGPVERDGAELEIASSTGVEFTTKTVHGLTVGDKVRIEGHLLNALNGIWDVATTPSTTRFTVSGASSAASGGATGTVTPILAIDLTGPNTKLWFTAKVKKSDDDASAFVKKGTANTSLTGITPDSPSSTKKNRATVRIDPADTISQLETADFYWEVQLEEPGSPARVTRLDKGNWQVEGAVVRA